MIKNNFQYPSVVIRPNTLKEVVFVSILWNLCYFLMWSEIYYYRTTNRPNRNKRYYSTEAIVNAMKNIPDNSDMKIYGKRECPKIKTGRGFTINTIYVDEFSL